MQASPTVDAIIEQLRKILASASFANAERSSKMLAFVVEQTVNGQSDRLKEYTLGVEALDRGDSFDPRVDPIVRAEASRLRARLDRYYADEGRFDLIEIVLPKGGYVPQFLDRTVAREVASPPPLPAPETESHRPGWLPWMAFAALAAVAVAFWSGTRVMPRFLSATAPVVQFEVASPPGSAFAPPISRQAFAISPDGRRLAFTANGPGGARIWIRDLASSRPQPVPGSEGAWTIFWAPDSRSIFYSVRRVIKQTDLETNTTRSVATLPLMAMYGAWRSPNDLVVYIGPTTFYEISTATGGTREIAGSDMRWAEFLPNSDLFVHVTFDATIGHYRALLTDYTTHRSTALMETDSRVEYASPRRPGELGQLLFIRGGTLLAQAFDSVHRRLVGEPSPLVQNVTHFGPSASACFSVSANGVLVYQTGYPLSELRWYDREGQVVNTLGRSMPFSGSLRISPDGHEIAAGVWGPDGGGQDVWVFDRDGRENRRLTFGHAVHTRPVWAHDGRRIGFTSSLTGAPRLATMEMDDRGREQALLNGSAADQIPKNQIQLPTDWSQDGRFIVYDTSLGEEEREVWIEDLKTDKISPLLQNGSSQWGAVFSPDSRQIAFISDESGQPEVYVQPFESLPSPHLVGVRRQVSSNGGWIVRWGADGREVFYLDIDAGLQEVRVVHGAVVGKPSRLFEVPGHPRYGTANDFQFDVAGSGERFVMTTAGGVPPADFTVVENWQGKFLR